MPSSGQIEWPFLAWPWGQFCMQLWLESTYIYIYICKYYGTLMKDEQRVQRWQWSNCYCPRGFKSPNNASLGPGTGWHIGWQSLRQLSEFSSFAVKPWFAQRKSWFLFDFLMLVPDLIVFLFPGLDDGTSGTGMEGKRGDWGRRRWKFLNFLGGGYLRWRDEWDVPCGSRSAECISEPLQSLNFEQVFLVKFRTYSNMYTCMCTWFAWVRGVHMHLIWSQICVCI